MNDITIIDYRPEHQPYFEKLVRRRVFERYIFLDKGEHAGTILGIYDRNGRPC